MYSPAVRVLPVEWQFTPKTYEISLFNLVAPEFDKYIMTSTFPFDVLK